METTTSTIIGVFNRYETAAQAARQLAAAGVPQDAIQIDSEAKTEAAGRSRVGNESETGGGISGFFHRLFGADTPEEHVHSLSNQYSDVIQRGGAVLWATVSDANVDRVVEVLNSAGAIDVDEQSADSGTVPITAGRSERSQVGTAEAGNAIPVIEEEVQIGKRVTRRGGVRVYSHVVEEPVEEEIALREEHVRVERRPVDRPVTPADESRLRDQSFEVTETAEEPVVQKRRRVKEEVIVGKETTERTERVQDTVRHTDVNVEPIDTTTPDKYREDFRRDYDANYAASGTDYKTLQPAYDYGYTMANDPRYKGKSWSDVESELRTDYLRRSPNSTWDRVKGAVRYAWESVTGRR
ncbi:MAG: YsnF/AvaK domain-containing protein [Acidobacteriia bacterium]|nr:YsnF/AvaK domain-containing protein [Terriglobia bacterium]MBV9743783.1 YsnF/AvaK domain-containing protein [Terriglobia bacterium]